MRAVSVLDQVDRISTGISTGGGSEGGGGNVSGRNYWWRCRDLNPGHCGYEFEPDEPARWRYLRKKLSVINKVGNFQSYF
jgi:hypothetical protein